MAVRGLLLLTITACIVSTTVTQTTYTRPLNRHDFPSDFIFGAASSAYQYEGAWNVSDKGQSIWDTFTTKYPERINGSSNGRVAEDTYHLYKEDVRYMKHMGLDAYRFSISWPRILPNGRTSSKPNADGIAYYNRLIDELISKGITPFVTIFHWDLPQGLEDEGGFLNDNIVNHFRDYADLCFAMFGDRVKHWITVNEPWSYSVFGYAYGSFPPNRCSRGANSEAAGFSVGRFARFAPNQECEAGDSGVEPYNISHNLLLSHAAAVQLYRQKYQAAQKGHIGISLNTEWMVPYNETSKKDQAAADRALAFMYGWFMEPLHKGTYPPQMVSHVKDRLPNFTKEQSELVKGSFDFIGLNYYTAAFAANIPNCPIHGSKKPSYLTDSCVSITKVKDGVPIGNETGLDWLYIYPEGIRDTLLYTQETYGNPTVYVTENGVSTQNLAENLTDTLRIYYHRQHLLMLQNLTRFTPFDTLNKTTDYLCRIDPSTVKGYFIWSLLDNFEWLDGYTARFGIMYIDYDSNRSLAGEGSYLNRTYKSSAKWFKNFLLPPVY